MTELATTFENANISRNTLATEFTNFLLEKWHIVKDMSELQFVSFIINETDEDYAHFVQYDIILHINN